MDAVALARLADAGFDIAHPFDAQAAAREAGLELLAPRAGRDERVGILVGNTRALWPKFTAAMRDPALAAERDPLERYTERAIDTAFPSARIYYGHRRYADRFLPFQRLAVAAGLGALAPTQLVIHPIYGPWFALRAVILVGGEPPPCATIVQPCRCDRACLDAVVAARATAPGRETWRAWLAVRDACALCTHRYSDDQIRYHYTKVWPATE